MGFPELADAGEAVAHRLSDGDVVGVATAVVPAVGRPEITDSGPLRRPAENIDRMTPYIE